MSHSHKLIPDFLPNRRTGLGKSAGIVSVLSAVSFELPIGSVSGPTHGPGGRAIGLSSGPWEDVAWTPSGTICIHYSPSGRAGIAQQRVRFVFVYVSVFTRFTEAFD